MQHYLWRAVGRDGEAVDVSLGKRRDGKAAKYFFKRLLPKHKGEPHKIVMDKLRSYNVAHTESSFQKRFTIQRNVPTIESSRVVARADTGERAGHGNFKSMEKMQRFLRAHAAIYNLFNLGHHIVPKETDRYFRPPASASWEKALAV
jgi:putative transposase